MIRLDFVSNSSSSSCIISSKKNTEDLIQAFKDWDKDPHSGFSYSEVLLERILKPATIILYGSYIYIRREREEGFDVPSFDQTNVLDEDVESIMNSVRNDTFKVEDLFPRFTPSKNRSSYNMPCGKITKDTVEFTRYFINKYCTRTQEEVHNEVNKQLEDAGDNIELRRKIIRPYIGCVFTDAFPKEKILSDLDKIEEQLKNNNYVYIVPLGYEGDGFEDDAYVFFTDWTEINSFFDKSSIQRMDVYYRW